MALLTYQAYWGRFSRGQHINFILNINQLPELVPIVTIWRDGTSLVEQLNLPRIKAASRVFRLTRLIGNQYDDGKYMAAMRFVVAGNTYCSVGYFEVSGGTGNGPLIAISEIDRTAGRGVVSQDSSGYFRLGYKPKRVT